jgi:hypothetical protein
LFTSERAQYKSEATRTKPRAAGLPADSGAMSRAIR